MIIATNTILDVIDDIQLHPTGSMMCDEYGLPLLIGWRRQTGGETVLVVCARSNHHEIIQVWEIVEEVTNLAITLVLNRMVQELLKCYIVLDTLHQDTESEVDHE
jgi:hypothetical protein